MNINKGRITSKK